MRALCLIGLALAALVLGGAGVALITAGLDEAVRGMPAAAASLVLGVALLHGSWATSHVLVWFWDEKCMKKGRGKR